MTKYTKAEKQAALENLRQLIQPGATVYTITRQTSASGMSRNISPIVFENGEPCFPAWNVAAVLGLTWVRGGSHDAVRVKGAGEDVGLKMVKNLSAALGYPINQQWL